MEDNNYDHCLNCPVKESVDEIQKEIREFPGINSKLSDLDLRIEKIEKTASDKKENNNKLYLVLLTVFISNALPFIVQLFKMMVK